jgi:GMP synthase-like glutamine amidotransferase
MDFLIVQSDEAVPPGILLDVLAARGVGWRLTAPGRGERLPSLSGIGALVVLGGRMGARDVTGHPFLGDLRRFVADAAERDIPLLGICLGGQILADVHGGELFRSRHGEKGPRTLTLTGLGIEDPLFHRVPYRFAAFQWHDDSFDPPRFAVRLAAGETCPNQAFRQDAGAYGLQFHPEVDRTIVARWAEGEPRLLRDFEAEESALRATGERIFTNFLRIAGYC